MAWTDRLRPSIKFFSPSGLEFEALWKGGEISAEKTLGRHSFPGLDGETVQDLGAGSRKIPLEVFFSGTDHDREAAAFEAALYERGPWEVIHPVFGLMRLQLVSYKFGADPVESGNATAFETEWIEPADEEPPGSPDPAAALESAADALKETAAEEALLIKQDSIAGLKAAAQAFMQGAEAAGQAAKGANAKINALQREINALCAEAYLDISSIAGAAIELAGAPALMLESLADKVSMFASLGRRVISELPAAGERSAAGINRALAGRLFINAARAGIGKAALESPPETRGEALAALDECRRFFLEAGAAANRRQEGSGKSAEAAASLEAALSRFLLEAASGFKAGKRIVLDRPRSPLEIAVSECGASAAGADSRYRLLCRANGLRGRELVLLPAGREIEIHA